MPQSQRTAFSLTALALTLTLAACSQQSAAPQPQAEQPQVDGRDGSQFIYDGMDHSWVSSDNGLTDLKAQDLKAGNNPLSSEPWTAATSGWGPVERNMSNGEKGSNDGSKLTIQGKKYDNGFGVHANSSMTFDLAGKCSRFISDVGLDDEVGNRGSVVFKVYADGIKLFDSGKMTGADQAKTVNVDVSGRKELKLVVTDAGDNIDYDHADWGGAVLVDCNVSSKPTPPAPAPTPPPSNNVKYSGPLVITKGGTYRGNWESMDPNVPAVYVKTSEPVVIEGSNLRGRGHLIRGWKVNLTVRNSNGYGMNPNVYGQYAGRFIAAEEVYNLRVENNYMEGTTGVYVNQFYGKGSGQTVKIVRNSVKNIDGRKSDGKGGYLNARYLVQFVQLAKVSNVPGIEIAWNQVINEPGKSSLEENINLYSTSGTSSSRIQIHDNYIQGAFAIQAATDSSYSGGGIMLGDGPVGNMTEAGGYVDVYNNQIISTSNQGVGIAGGHDHKVFNNRILSSGRLPSGEINKAQNVGIYVWDVMNGKRSKTWFNNTVYDNVIGWTRVNSNNSTWLNNTWFADCTSTCYNNKSWSGAVTLETEKQEYQLWLSKYRAAGMSVGPN
ncbi:glycosyl hydrolase [Deinococcus radiopugnans]|uniref:Glycosyl hydrolase n=1 Tax=Deinococcus radiopugnans TaxID=57497 RepID=A0A0A7KJC8_9DEIO|nr:NPCBM/NEW2 domain-containing protein [Deinococcus radiopugnans]AIZ46282.1 glycosyl hydrolase [Deinococcus radiopugnans]